MNEEAINQYILDTFEGITTYTTETESGTASVASGDTFYFYDPERKFPFVTLVTADNYEKASNLSRPGVYRLNIGVGKETFRKLFGSGPVPVEDSGYDFAVLDKVIPHSVYGRMHWVSVLNPSEATFAEQVRPLLDEAYAIAVRRYGPKVKTKEEVQT
jgi:hypothetical protein